MPCQEQPAPEVLLSRGARPPTQVVHAHVGHVEAARSRRHARAQVPFALRLAAQRAGLASRGEGSEQAGALEGTSRRYATLTPSGQPMPAPELAHAPAP